MGVEEREAEGGERTRGARSRELVAVAGLFYGLMLAASLAWAHWTDRPLFFASARAERLGVDWGGDAALGLGAAALLVVASRLFTRRTRWGDRSARALAELLGPVGLRAALWLGVVSGVAEEALFRGVLQVETGWLPASLLFGLAHLAPRRDLLPWTANAFAAGFLLGALFDVTGNLLAPVLTHSVVNALNLRWLSLHFAEPGSPPQAA
ncbi:MAG: CPBP family intramembrane metalloprotease [Myxococcales bacterium]|nr:CPBP family intramembrane metalloprotease [Myxococcales bacterium]